MLDLPAARLVNALRAWEDFETYPTSDARRFRLAQLILEDACRRLPAPLVLVASDVRRDDGGWGGFGRDGWGFFLTVAVIGARVRASVDQLRLLNGKVLGAEGGIANTALGVPLLEAKPVLIQRLKRRVEDSRGPGQKEGAQWFGELVESWTGMWRDQSYVVLDEFVNPRRGLLWNNVGRGGEWQTARWAWLTFNNPLRNPFGTATGKRIEMWQLPEDHVYRDRHLHGPHLKWVGRKWPESPEKEQYSYEKAELDRALRILQLGAEHPLELDPDSIPLLQLVRPRGITIQQRVLHYLTMDPKGPRMRAERVATLLGFDDPRDVRKAAKKCDRALRT
jgi:hypothetical protein